MKETITADTVEDQEIREGAAEMATMMASELVQSVEKVVADRSPEEAFELGIDYGVYRMVILIAKDGPDSTLKCLRDVIDELKFAANKENN